MKCDITACKKNARYLDFMLAQHTNCRGSCDYMLTFISQTRLQYEHFPDLCYTNCCIEGLSTLLSHKLSTL